MKIWEQNISGSEINLNLCLIHSIQAMNVAPEQIKQLEWIKTNLV